MLVVHGLGEQGAGKTLDDLAGGLWGDQNTIHVDSDVRQLQEEKHADPRRLSTFPCHMRRYASLNDRTNPHTTFAEVYWADLSEADQGAISIFYGLIKTILGLGHIVRAAAKQYFGAGSFAGKIANFVPYMMHGPVAAVNVALAVGLLLLFAASKIFGDIAQKPEVVHATLVLAGVALLAYGWSQRNHTVYYFRIFVSWVGVFGAVLGLLAAAQYFGFELRALKLYTAQALLGPDATAQGLIASYGVVLLLCLKLAWIVASLATMCCLVATCWTRTRADRGDGKRVRIPALPLILICAMTWLWMLVVSTIWVSVERTDFFEDLLSEDLVNNGVQLLVFALTGVLIIFLCTCVTLAKHKIWSRHFSDNPSDINDVFSRHPVPRLLLSGPLAAGLVVAGLLLSVAACFALLQLVVWLLGWGPLGDSFEDWNGVLLQYAIAVAGTIGALAYSQREGIAQALGVGKDLVTYFKVEPVFVGDQKTDAEAMHGFSAPTDYEFTDFRLRNRIHARMQRVLSALWEDTFEELIVVSHSQGTIIATEFAKELQNPNTQLIPKEARERLAPIMQKATLVTMGSPFTHVYNYYLPDEFGGPQSVKEGEMISKWINIFRIDDFIGTHIGPSDLKGKWPVNYAVPAAGHTGYWTDANVITRLRPLVN